MSLLSRKLTFQLTPLLDLLLIVIFAQYMEVQEATKREKSNSAVKVEEAVDRQSQAERKLTESRDELQEMHESQQRQLHALERMQQETEDFKTDAAQREAELNESLKRTRRQRDLVAQLAAEFFRIPEELVREELLAENEPYRERTPQEIARLRQRFQELSKLRAAEVVKHLLTYEELRKRCDVWEVHIADSGLMTFTAGDRHFDFRADQPELFETKMFEFYKSLPQPKSLVIILLSYGNVKAIWRESAKTGLRRAADRMREDSNGRSRFEYAILGYRTDQNEPEQPGR